MQVDWNFIRVGSVYSVKTDRGIQYATYLEFAPGNKFRVKLLDSGEEILVDELHYAVVVEE